MVSCTGYAPVILPVLASNAILCSVSKGCAESASGCITVHFRYVPIAVVLKALGDYTIPTVRFAFIDLVVPD